MTRPFAPDRLELAPVVDAAQRRWIPPFVMTVIGDIRIFEALAPAVAPGPTQKLSGGAHFWRTLLPFKTGYLTPGSGSYAEALRQAHRAGGISAELLGLAVSWNAVIMCRAAELSGHRDIVPQLKAAAEVIAFDMDGDIEKVIDPDAALHMQAHFWDITIIPPMRDAFWEVMAYPKIRQILGDVNDKHLLEACHQYLPASFVNQFTHD